MRKYTKIISLISLVAMLAMLVAFSPVLAKNDKTDEVLPEQDGVYDVPKHPELKMRVFVHKAKPATVLQSPSLYCPLADPDSTAVVGRAGWKLPLNVGYYLNISSVPSGVGGGNWQTIAQNSFDAWTQNGTGHSITYKGETSTNKATLDQQNILSWGSTSASALAVTYTWYYRSTGEAVEVDTIMNQNYAWKWSDQLNCAWTNSYDAQDILTHELGHWFGLNDHYTKKYINNTMYGYGSQKETKKDTLTAGDIAGLRSVYGL